MPKYRDNLSEKLICLIYFIQKLLLNCIIRETIKNLKLQTLNVRHPFLLLPKASDALLQKSTQQFVLCNRKLKGQGVDRCVYLNLHTRNKNIYHIVCCVQLSWNMTCNTNLLAKTIVFDLLYL